MQEARARFRRRARAVGSHRLIFLDEFGTHLGMTRRYGRALRGRRALGKTPCNTDPNITLVMGLRRHKGVVAPLAFEGAMNGAVFEAYVRQNLAPELQPDDIVVVDGLSAHRVRGAREAIEARGATYWILPPYSPDLSPVENCGSKVKESLRAEAPRSIQAVYEAIGRALGKTTPQDAEGWFQHAGYLRSPLSSAAGRSRVARCGPRRFHRTRASPTTERGASQGRGCTRRAREPL